MLFNRKSSLITEAMLHFHHTNCCLYMVPDNILTRKVWLAEYRNRMEDMTAYSSSRKCKRVHIVDLKVRGIHVHVADLQCPTIGSKVADVISRQEEHTAALFGTLEKDLM